MSSSSIADQLRSATVREPKSRVLALSGPRLGLGLSVLVSLVLANVLLEILSVVGGGMFAMDFRAPIFEATRNLLHGQNPYPSADHNFVHFPAVVVMPVVMFVVAPLALLPEMVAVGIWLALLGASAIATVRVLGFADRRHMFLWLAGAPVVIGVLHGNTILFVGLALALVWRYRDRPGIAGACVAAAATLKLWPAVFIVWLWVTGRRRAAVYALAATFGLIFGGWAAIGFRGIGTYPHMLSTMSEQLADRGAWLISSLVHAGLGYRAASGVGLIAAAGLLLLVPRLRRESDKFLAATLAGITATSTSWLHYMSLLVIPSKGRGWLLMPALWLSVDIGWVYGPGARAVTTVLLVTIWTVALRVSFPLRWRAKRPDSSAPLPDSIP